MLRDKKLILPTFIIPGAGKSGTTYILEVLGKHDDIFTPFSKEPAFFSTDKYGGYFHKGFNFYQKNFFNYKGQRHIGEASTVYMYDPESPRLIKKYIPKVQLIFILRNPIERVYSNYWQEIKAGKKLKDFSNLVFKKDIIIEKMIYISRYDIHLKRYLSYFSFDQIKILLFEELKEDSLSCINKILHFLELEPFDNLPTISKVNSAAVPRIRILSRLLRNEMITQNIKAITPARLAPFLKFLLDKTRKWVISPISYPPMDQNTWEYLADEFSECIKNLSQLINIDLSYWLDYPFICKNDNFYKNRVLKK